MMTSLSGVPAYFQLGLYHFETGSVFPQSSSLPGDGLSPVWLTDWRLNTE